MEDYKKANIEKYKNNIQKEKILSKKRGLEIFRKDSRKLFKKDDRILDIGGGAGVQTDILREEIGISDVYAIDISEDVLRERNSKDKCMVGDMENLPYENEFFDKVLFLAALHHTNKTEKTLSEAKRVLKKEGCIIFSEPVSLKSLVLRRDIRPTPDGVEFYFSISYLFKHLKRQDLKIKFVRYNGFLTRFSSRITKNKMIDHWVFNLEYLINKIPVLKCFFGLLSNKVFVAVEKIK